MEKCSLGIEAFVLLPDHLHCTWTLPDWDRDFSKRWHLIKSCFSDGCDDRFVHYGIYDREWSAGPDISFNEAIGKE